MAETDHAKALVGVVVAGKYRVDRVIGAGAMGVVCAARHVELGKRVALKVIASDVAGSDEVTRRFHREARAASMVESDHIVHVFDVGRDDAVGLYMVMELLTGEDLSKRLERTPVLEVDLASRIAFQIARALGKAHAAGVVHRDLKPANVFLVARDDGGVHVKVLDFGISKILGQEQMARSGQLVVTRIGTVLGTPQYASPEQAQGMDTVDKRTDVWSLGVMLYEMLAGKPAYGPQASYEQFIIRLATTPPEPLAKVAPWVPKPLADVVHAAIQHDLAARIPDCDTFARVLVSASPALSAQRAAMKSLVEAQEAHSADATVQMPTRTGSSSFPPPPSATAVMSSPPDIEGIDLGDETPAGGYFPPLPAPVQEVQHLASGTTTRRRVEPPRSALSVYALVAAIVIVIGVTIVLLAMR